MRKRTTSSAVLVVLAAACGNGADDAGSSSGDGGRGTPAAGSGGTEMSGGSGAGGPTGGQGAGGPTAMPCGTFSEGDAFQVCAATYLGGALDDDVGGVAVGPDGAVVYAGTIDGEDLGQTPNALLGGGKGVVARLSSDGRTWLSLTRLGDALGEVVRTADGLAVGGDFGVAVLNAEASAVQWSADVGGQVSDVAVGSDGAVVGRRDKSIHVFAADGEALGSFEVGATRINDIAVHGGEATIFVTGFKQDDGPPCSQLQIPFVRAYGYDGTLKWTNYDWNRTEVGDVSECADSRGMAVTIGDDGMLYYAGESHGGNTVHRRLPKDLSQMAPNVKPDKYSDPYNLNGAAPITFFGRFDPATGDYALGSFLCTRLSSDKANAARPSAIAATADGGVIVAGATACCIENGDTKTVNGEPAMGEYLGGGFLMVVSPDFEQRRAWTTFRGADGGGERAVALALGAGNVVAAFQQDVDGSTTESPLLTFDAIQPAPGGGARDGYLTVFPAP
ncbi:MAG: hypothetical protein AAGN82_27435 [Myxococcota bacterium]